VIGAGFGRNSTGWVRVERACGAGQVRVASLRVRGGTAEAVKNSQIPAGAGRVYFAGACWSGQKNSTHAGL